MKNGVKMLDIATKLGVSVVTVSNALAGRDGVSEQMRKRICETAEKMGYKPSNTKSEKRRMAIPKISKNVGILTSEYRRRLTYVLSRGNHAQNYKPCC